MIAHVHRNDPLRVRTEAYGRYRNADVLAYFSLAITPPSRITANAPSSQRLNATGLKEIGLRGFADPHMTTDPGELDSPFRDQAPDEPRPGAKMLRGLLNRQQHGRRHAALPRCRKITVRWHRGPAPGLG